MNQFIRGTFNTMYSGKAEFGGNFPVWVRVNELYQGGGRIDHTKFPAGTVIGAGTPVVFAGPGKDVKIVAGPAYSNQATYKKGDIVSHEGKIYENKTAITVKEEWTAGKWTDITTTVNGFVFEDVFIPEGCTLATCAVVRAGRIYADRVIGAEILPAMEARLDKVIEFTREG